MIGCRVHITVHAALPLSLSLSLVLVHLSVHVYLCRRDSSLYSPRLSSLLAVHSLSLLASALDCHPRLHYLNKIRTAIQQYWCDCILKP